MILGGKNIINTGLVICYYYYNNVSMVKNNGLEYLCVI